MATAIALFLEIDWVICVNDIWLFWKGQNDLKPE